MLMPGGAGDKSKAQGSNPLRTDAQRRIQLEVLARRRPLSSGNKPMGVRPYATPSTNNYSMMQNQRGASPGTRPALGSRELEGPFKRLPIDGVIRHGTETVEWRQRHQHPIRYPLASAHNGLPWLDEQGQARTSSLTRPVPAQHYAERTLGSRYHQLLLQGRSRGYQQDASPPAHGHGQAQLVREVHHHHHYEGSAVQHQYEEQVPYGDLPLEARQSTSIDSLGGVPLEYVPAGEEAHAQPERDMYAHEREAQFEHEARYEEEASAQREAQAYQDDQVNAQREREPLEQEVHETSYWNEGDEHHPSRRSSLDDSHGLEQHEQVGGWPGETGPDPSLPTSLAKFRAALDCGDAHDTDQRRRRDELWAHFDPNETEYVSLAECNGGVLDVLIHVWGKEGHRLFKRYYRSYIRAFVDVKDATPPHVEKDEDYVARSEFRLLLVYLGLYATWYEVFMTIDGGTEGVTIKDDHRLSREEWAAALPHINHAGRTWADSLALANAREEDFESVNRGGVIGLQEFCEWVEQAEKSAGSAQGTELGVSEPIGAPAHHGRRSQRRPLELGAANMHQHEF